MRKFNGAGDQDSDQDQQVISFEDRMRRLSRVSEEDKEIENEYAHE